MFCVQNQNTPNIVGMYFNNFSRPISSHLNLSTLALKAILPQLCCCKLGRSPLKSVESSGYKIHARENIESGLLAYAKDGQSKLTVFKHALLVSPHQIAMMLNWRKDG